LLQASTKTTTELVGKSYRFFASELAKHFNMNVDIIKENSNV
jgi:hypothetical protein